MDYCEDFRLVQTTMIHCNEFVKKFEKIIFFGGSEVYIDEIAMRLRNIFLSKSYTSDCNELRKITFLLMLNTDVSFSRDLSEDFSLCHLLNNFPQITNCLFVHLVWQLKLHQYLYEAIKYSPSWFMLQFVPEAIDSLRFSKPLEVLTQVKDLVESIYCNICRMDYKVATVDQQIEQKIILNKLLEHIMSLLRHYNTPNADDEISKSKKKLKEYLGHSLNIQLYLIQKCFAMFKCKPEFKVPEELNIYKIMISKEPEFDNNSNTSYSSVVHDSLSKINIALLNTLQNSVVNITLDDFMQWVEIDIDDPSTEDKDLKRDNLQKSVGELSYRLIQFISENEEFEHNVVKQLETISIKPKSLEELAKEATVGTVLDRIETSSSRRVWFEELLSRSDTLYYNTECLQTIIDNISIVQFDDLMRIIADHQQYNMDRDDEILLKEIFRQGGELLKDCEIKEFVEELIRVLGVDYHLLHDDEDIKFASELTNYSNQLTESSMQEEKMWKLILLNPSRFYENLLGDVSYQDKAQIEVILSVLNVTSPLTDDYLKHIVISKLEAAAETSKSQYHIFLAGLFKSRLIDRKEFVHELLMENLAHGISAENHSLVSLLLNTLRQVSAKLKVEELLAPLTILLAQILDKYRWDLVSFNQVNESIVESSIEIIQDLVKTVLTQGTQKDKDWINAKIKDFKPMTKFYFQKLSLEKGEPITAFDKFLHPVDFNGIPKGKITSFLCETTVRCTSKEFKWLMTNEKLQKFITDTVYVITVIVSKSPNQQNPLNCLHKCVSDYVKVLKDVIVPSNNEDQDQLKELFKNILKIIKNFPQSSFEELTILFLDVLKSFKDCEGFAVEIANLNESQLKRILLEEVDQ